MHQQVSCYFTPAKNHEPTGNSKTLGSYVGFYDNNHGRREATKHVATAASMVGGASILSMRIDRSHRSEQLCHDFFGGGGFGGLKMHLLGTGPARPSVRSTVTALTLAVDHLRRRSDASDPFPTY